MKITGTRFFPKPTTMKQLLCLTLFCILYSNHVFTQSAPVGDCLGAIPVCQQIYSEVNAPSGIGNDAEINPSFNCMQSETNSIWYTFTVNNSGNFGFLLTPNNAIDDYDLALFDITNASCEDLFDRPELIVSCNAAGGTGCLGPTGATGDTDYNDQGFNCGTEPPNTFDGFSPFNALVPVLEGNTYVLCVSNWSGSPNGYVIDFGLSSDIGIFDEERPFVENLNYPEDCSDDVIEVNFSEPIQCSSIEALNFQLDGPGGPYSLTLSSPSCDQGGAFANDFFLEVNPPINQLGDYALSLVVNEINEVLDPCDNPAANASFTFSPTDLVAPANLGPDLTICDGQSIVLDVYASNAHTYIWQDMSTEPTFLVTQPGLYYVEVISNCGSNTDSIMIDFQNELPPLDFGADLTICFNEPYTLDATTPGGEDYLWQDGSTSPTFTVTESGNYAVTVSGTCGETTDAVNVEVLPQVEATLEVISLCGNETITWDVNTPYATYLWQDGSTDPLFTASEAGLYSVTISTECEIIILEAEVSQVEEAPSIDLGENVVLCPDDPALVLDATFEGATYLWQDGSTQAMLAVTQAGLYSVTFTNGCGSDEASIEVGVVEAIEPAKLQDTVLCPGQSLVLDATSLNATSYRWQDGTEEPTLRVTNPGDYGVFVGNECEQILLESTVTECRICQIYVPNAFSPNDDGINDKFRPFSDCELLDFNIRIFNRWGDLVFESTNPEEGWEGEFNGKLLNMGTYIWMLQFNVNEDGNLRLVEMSGDVTILK